MCVSPSAAEWPVTGNTWSPNSFPSFLVLGTVWPVLAAGLSGSYVLCFQACRTLATLPQVARSAFPFLAKGEGDDSQCDLGSCVLITEPPSGWVPENWEESCLAEFSSSPELLDEK